jgi:hypothetical protein
MQGLGQPGGDLRSRIVNRIGALPHAVWTPGDFADLAGRAAVDKTLQRLAGTGTLRRIDRGLYDLPRTSRLTGRPSVPDYREVIRAVARRQKVRYVVDGMTAASELGLTTAVPARIEVFTDAPRLKSILLGKQAIHFKAAASSRLYWADHPAMRIVQALYWLQGGLADEDMRTHVIRRLRSVLADPVHGQAMRDDLRAGFAALPIWMQEFLRGLIAQSKQA